MAALRTRVRELSAALSRTNIDFNPESLSKEETLRLLLDLLQKVSCSEEMIRRISQNQDFSELVWKVSNYQY